MQRLRHGEWIAGLSALALFGLLFVEWFDVSEVITSHRGGTAYVAAFSGHGSGWASLGWAALALCDLAILAALALAIVAVAYESPVLPVVASISATLFGGLAIVALLIQVIAQPGRDEIVEVKAGWWLGLIASFGIVAGGWLAMRDERSPNARPRPVEVRPMPPVAPG